MHIIKDRYVTVINPTKDLLTNCKKALTIANPAYGANKQMGISNFATPRNLQYYEYDKTNDILRVPVGFWQESYHYMTAVDNRSDVESEIINDLQFNGTLRPEQEKAVKTLATYSNGVLSAPTGSGKTVIALALIKMLKRKTLFVVDTIDLANQFIARCKTFLGYEPGLIGSGKFEVKDISVGILKTLTILDDGAYRTINESFGCTIVDECHIVPAAMFFNAINKLNTKYKYGLSATVTGRKDGLTKVIYWGLGPKRHEIPLEVAAKDLCIPKFEYIETEFEFPIFNPREYGKMLEFLMTDDKRNNLIVEARIRYKDKKAVILVKRKEHAKLLSEMIPGAAYVTSSFTKKRREEVMNSFLNGDCHTLCGTFQLLAKGLDSKDIELAIIAAPTNVEIDTKQLIGRTMRPAEDKEAVIVDIVDNKIGMLEKASKNRKKWYKKYIELSLK